MNWNCENCKKSVSFWEKTHTLLCNACTIEQRQKKEEEERQERLCKVYKFMHIFKLDQEKFYKTVAVLAMINGIEYDENNNNTIFIRNSNTL